MNESKPAVFSSAVWGNSAGIVASVVAIVVAKTHLPEEVVYALVASLSGHLLSLWGRLKASKRISGLLS